MGFSAAQAMQDTAYMDGLPKGRYQLRIEEAKMRVSSTGFDMVSMKIRSLGNEYGSYKNAIHWENLTIGHNSQTVADYAKRKLAEIMMAAGITDLNETADGKLDLSPLENKEVAGVACQSKSGNRYVIYMLPTENAPAMTSSLPPHQAPTILPPPDGDYDDDIPF